MGPKNLAVVLAPNLTEYKDVSLTNGTLSAVAISSLDSQADETFQLLANQVSLVTFIIENYLPLFKSDDALRAKVFLFVYS